jgi:histidinol dehydrogenase
MKTELQNAIRELNESGTKIKDICFSGNGEPSLSFFLKEALDTAHLVRNEFAPEAKLVLITNGAGLLNTEVFDFLKHAVNDSPALDLWLKLDAGTPQWYEKINRSKIPFYELVKAIGEFTEKAPVTIQTMLCKADGFAPSIDEKTAWEQLLCDLAQNGAANSIRKVQIYGKVRPAPEDPYSSPLPYEYLEERASSLRRAFVTRNIEPPLIEVFE